ncbi:MAG: hypothetical protein AB1428_12970 [Bacteroidota bacterium]
MGWIQTYRGKRFDPLTPDTNLVSIIDIAHALSNIPRLGGHAKPFYSVAQHSILVAEIVPEFGLQALLHDATEAYLLDIPSPIKHSHEFLAYRRAEEKLHREIMWHFGLSALLPDEVRAADRLALKLEANWHMSPMDPELAEELALLPGTMTAYGMFRTPLGPREAETRFLTTFHDYWKDHAASLPNPEMVP